MMMTREKKLVNMMISISCSRYEGEKKILLLLMMIEIIMFLCARTTIDVTSKELVPYIYIYEDAQDHHAHTACMKNGQGNTSMHELISTDTNMFKITSDQSAWSPPMVYSSERRVQVPYAAAARPK